MLIQLLKDIFVHKSGTVLDVDAKTASVLIKRQQAVEYKREPEKAVSTASVEPETATTQKAVVKKTKAKAKNGRPKKK